MAWLKFDTATPEKPEVLQITMAMGWDDPDLTVGKLLKLWRWFDVHTVDGNAAGVSAALLDRLIGVTGFAKAVADAGWLIIHESGLTLPNFCRHNGKTAKDRVLTAQRVASHKDSKKGNASIVTSALPREEKRREEVKEHPPNPPLGGDEAPVKKSRRDTAVSFDTFVERCKAAGERALSDYRPVWDYAERACIPRDFIELCWLVFRDRYGKGGARESKRYTDWRKTFRIAVEDNWLKLWAHDQAGQCYLTTQGRQAENTYREDA